MKQIRLQAILPAVASLTFVASLFAEEAIDRSPHALGDIHRKVTTDSADAQLWFIKASCYCRLSAVE